MACRNYVLKVVLGYVFKSSYGLSGGPNLTRTELFVRFRDSRGLIETASWSSALKRESVQDLLNGELSEHRKVTLNGLKRALESGSYPREDYEELT